MAAVTKADVKDIYSLSPMQQGMLFHYLADEKSSIYFEQLSIRIVGDIDPRLLEQAFTILTRRHDILRTVFVYKSSEKPRQVVLKHRDAPVYFEDISHLEEEKKAACIEQLKNKDREKGFNLSADVLLRYTVIKVSDTLYELLWSFHHIIMDGWSNAILIKEWLSLYQGLKEGRSMDLPAVVPYSRYIKWLETQDKQEGLDYWKYYLEGYDSRSSIPKTRKPFYDGQVEQESFKFEFDPVSTRALIKMSTRNNVTLNTLFLAIWGVLLQIYNNTEDVVFGAVTSGRSADINGIEEMIGLFINTIPVRVRGEGGQEFITLVKRLQTELNQSRKYEHLPLAEIQAGSLLKANLLDHIVAFENYPLAEELAALFDKGRLGFYLQKIENVEWSNYDMNIVLVPGETLAVRLLYNALVYDRSTLIKIESHLKQIAVQVISDWGMKPKDLTILTESEKKQILVEFNNTTVEYPMAKTVHQLFEEQVERTPDRIALVDQCHMTYRQLNEKSNRMGSQLITGGVETETIVAINVRRSIEMMIGILGILKAGGTYLPIDPDYPADRIQFMLKDSNAKILINKSESPRQRHPIKNINGQDKNPSDWMVLDFEHLNFECVSNVDSGASDLNSSNLAYIMYTSGSTGRPKAVSVEHRNVVRLVINSDYVELTGNTRLLQTGAPVFDAVTFEMWGPLLNGGMLFLVENHVILDADKLGQALKTYQINTLWLSSSLFNQLMQQNSDIFSVLEYLVVGGDVLSPRYIAEVRDRNRGLKVVNGYGPTENTTFSVCYCIERDFENNIPIGKPIHNSTAYILDKYNRPQPIGVQGELYVGGDGLSRGYLNNPELTAEKFIFNRSYKTGDLARWMPDPAAQGAYIIEFLGRIDQQVKVRGYRIEPGEIENYLMAVEYIQEAVVINKKDQKDETYLAAYIVSIKPVDAAELRNILSESLPDYMIPSFFTQLEKIPLTPNGKLDRNALPEPGEGISDSGDKYAAPTSETEKLIAEIWGDVLGVQNPGINDDFFDSGGHSLKAMNFISLVHKRLNVKIPLIELFEHPTINGISQLIGKTGADIYSSITITEKRDYYTLSSAQNRLAILDQLEKGSIRYNTTIVLELEGSLDTAALENVFKRLIKRHEVFRTAVHFSDGNPIQVIYDHVDFALEYYHKGNAAPNREERIETIIYHSFIRPFDLSHAPLMRVGVIKIEDMKNLLMVDIHHIFCDGVSFDIIVNDISKLYSGENLPELKLQYKDYAVWQQEMMISKNLKDEESYWLEKLSGEIPVLKLATDYPRPAFLSIEGSCIDFNSDRELTHQIKKFCRDRGVTLYMTLLAAYNALLYRYTNQDDIIVGTATAGRPHADLQHIVGMFVNMLAMRNHPSGEKTFNQVLQEVKENALNAYQNQHYQFEELVMKLDLNRDLSRNPLFDTEFTMQNMAVREMHLPGLQVKESNFNERTAKFDIAFLVYEIGDEIWFHVNYCTRLFKSDTIEQLCRHYIHLVQEVVGFPKLKLHEIPILSDPEQHRLLYEFNNTAVDYPRDLPLHRLIECRVEKTPDSIAAAGPSPGTYHDSPVQITYRELNEKSDRTAHLLTDKGVEPETIVGIMAERSVGMIIAILGIFKSNAAYLPIDPGYPEEKVKFLLADSSAGLMVTTRDLAEKGQKLETWAGETILLEEITHSSNRSAHFHNLVSAYSSLHSPSNLAYVIYTSGSTGKPKGAIVEHRGMVNHMQAKINDLQMDAESIVAQTASHTFDISIWQFFAAIAVGGKTVIYPHSSLLEPARFIGRITRDRVNIIEVVPSYLTLLLDTIEKLDRVSLPLHFLLVTGEEVKPHLVKKWFRLFPGIKMVNAYGPTEASDDITHCIMEKAPEAARVPIGKPVQNLKIYIVDEFMNLCPIGIEGELCVSGIGVGRGYLNNQSKTGQVFMEDPFREEKGVRLYKTGDLGTWRPDGVIEFRGRKDSQVKIRGFRIELGEIETSLLESEDVKEVVVTVSEDEVRGSFLCAYIVPGGNGKFNVDHLKTHLLNKLPEYMIPAYFVEIEAMPLLPNGKVNRKMLPEPKMDDQTIKKEFEAPGTKTEKKIASIWSDILKRDTIGIHDNFFDLGGHSLLIPRLFNKLEKVFPGKVTITDLFEYLTIHQVARHIEGIRENESDDDLIVELSID